MSSNHDPVEIALGDELEGMLQDFWSFALPYACRLLANITKNPRQFKDLAVCFPGTWTIGTLYTILVPLNFDGTPKVGGELIKYGYCYQIHKECRVEVPGNGKLVAIVIRSH
ncbi:hypothetical protein I7I51_04882 [Histoplasma capsulatum]|uniref:Uncharacterized protein n=1 Tax=Ajellomyces capsulatus TaxID=5037 RepID=A0A8A1M0V6_AJECA|nr:hypothetical protein I7I51_04882 [Histoplasma capsulatum]